MKISNVKAGLFKSPGKKFNRVIVRLMEPGVVKDNTDFFTLGNEFLELDKNKVGLIGFFVKITVKYV